MEQIYLARQSGKTAMLKQRVAEAEAASEWVAIASKDGFRCSRCSRTIDACRRSCMEPGETLVGEAAFYVERGEAHCRRCGDTNYDGDTLVCLTCTYPDDPCSKAYWDATH